MNAVVVKQAGGITAPGRQRGAVLLLVLMVLFVAGTMLFLSRLPQGGPERHLRLDTARVLAQAREALLGYAVTAQRPGELPCPDVDGDGVDDYAGGACVAELGRLPWRVLDAGELRDGSGERLWYAVSPGHAAGGGGVLNSSTPGALVLDGRGDFVAVLLAPLQVVDGQLRDAANRNAAAAYLEGDNAAGGPFVTSGPQPFRDQVLGVTRAELMQAVQRRVQGEMEAWLQAYYDLRGYYPYAAAQDDGPDYYCDQGVREGRLPLAIGAAFVPASGNACAALGPWPQALPDWFIDNRWTEVFTYTIAGTCAPGVGCAAGDAALGSEVFEESGEGNEEENGEEND